MAVRITYFVHGTTIDNERGISSGWNDAGLSELGVEQAKQLRGQTADKPLDAVFCSDLKRARDTAHFVFEGRAPIIPDAKLRECNYGKFNGSLSSVVEPLQEKNIIEKFPGGESYEDVKARMADFLEFLKKNYDGKSVGIVSHKAPHLALDALLKGKTWEQAFGEYWGKTKSWQPGWDYVA